MGTKFTVGGRQMELTADQVARAMRGIEPELISKHVVEMDGTVFPPKQVLATVTGWERQSFTTQEAQRVLKRLGFVCRRASETDRGAAWIPVALERGSEGSLEERVAVLEASNGTALAAIRGLHDRLERIEERARLMG